mmetsp:Transcript_8809/g.16452  ORF Transcript_8809/g.16452 Transcript_8809/m.16452 type:complete len:87 (+) Transcript_8809:3530-3790(+)
MVDDQRPHATTLNEVIFSVARSKYLTREDRHQVSYLFTTLFCSKNLGKKIWTNQGMIHECIYMFATLVRSSSLDPKGSPNKTPGSV